MNDFQFIYLQNTIIGRLTQIGTLASTLQDLLGESAKQYSRELQALTDDPLFKDDTSSSEAAQEGYHTLLDIKKLSKKDPERAHQILKRLQILFRHSVLRAELDLTEQVYPNLTLSSLTIMAFAFFEQSLVHICNFISKIRGTSLRLTDLNGQSTTEKAQRFLLKVAGVQYDFSKSEQWTRIKGHQDVRNLLAHNGGLLDESDRSKRVKDFVAKDIAGLSIIGGGLTIESDYVEGLVNDIQEWLIDIFDLLNGKN